MLLRLTVMVPLFIAPLLAGCMPGSTALMLSPASPQTRAIDGRFSIQPVSWTTGDENYYVVRLVEDGGLTTVCGAYSATDKDRHSNEILQRSLARTAVVVGEERLVSGIGFFNRVRHVSGQWPVGAANCVRTDVPWREVAGRADDVGIKLSPRSIRIRD